MLFKRFGKAQGDRISFTSLAKSTGTRHYTERCELPCWQLPALMINHDRLLKNSSPIFFPEFVALFLPDVTVYLKRDSCVSWIQKYLPMWHLESDTKLMRVVQAQFRVESIIHLEHQALQTLPSIDWGSKWKNLWTIQPNGFNLEASQLRDEFALSQLCGVIARQWYFLVLQGTQVVAFGKRRLVDQNKSEVVPLKSELKRYKTEFSHGEQRNLFRDTQCEKQDEITQ